MATAQLTIAKASLLAALLKPDASAGLPPCSRDDIEQLHGLLSAAAARCSPANVQKCKQWLLQHLVQSPVRTAALGRYLVAFVNFQTEGAKSGGGGDGGQKPSARRRRLHMLYVLSDVLFHVKHRTESTEFLANIESHLPALFKSAAAFAHAPKHEKKLQDLIQLWQQKAYFPDSFLDQLRTAVSEGPRSTESEPNSGDVAKKAHAASSATARDAPYVLPSMHGDPSTPWYDLPAANWLPVIEPNNTRPMNPSMIRPLQLAGGAADKSLVQAVKKLLGDVDKIYGKDARPEGDSPNALDFTQMGEVIERDEMGEVVSGETYYGWSRAFCEKMKQRKQRGDSMGLDDDRRGRGRSSRSSSRSRSRSRDRSSSRSSSRPAMKRRRFSNSRSRSRSRSRRGESWSKSRSRRRSYSRNRSRSYSSRSRSRSPRRGLDGIGPDQRSSHSHSSYSPSRALGPSAVHNIPRNGLPPPLPPNFIPPNPQQQQQQQQHTFNAPPPSLPPNFPGAPNFVPPPLSQHPHHQFPPQPGFDAWSAPVPPPPPPHYQGHWPPPPPSGGPGAAGLPQPTLQGWFPPSAGSPPPPPIPGPLPAHAAWGGGWAPPIPPPPPPGGPPPGQAGSAGGYGYGYGNRGGAGGNGGYRGRGGGYGRGRGW